MNIAMGIWFLAFGAAALVRPSLFYKAGELSPESVRRNRKLIKRFGAAMLVLGAALLAVELLRRRG